MAVSGHMEENPVYGIVIPIGRFARGIFIYLKRCIDEASWDSLLPNLRVQKGMMLSQTMWTLYIPPPNEQNARDPIAFPAPH